MAMALGALDQTIVTTALPTIAGDLHGLDYLAWVATAYMLAATIGLPVYGKVGDLVGRKPVFVFAIVLFLVGSALAGASQSIEQLVVFRSIQGLGGGGLMIGALAIVAEVVAPRDRGRLMGVIGAVFAFASVAGPLVGGYVTDTIGWRWVFYINVPLGASALVLVVLTLRVSRPERRRYRFDIAGALLLALVSTAIVLFSTWAGTTYAWLSLQTLILAGIAVAGLVAFVLVERRAREPLIPLSLFAERNFVLPTLVGVTVSIIMFVTLAYLPLYLQMVARVDATVSGLMLVPMSLGMLVSTSVTGRLISATGRYKLYPIIGCALSGIGLFMLSNLHVDSPLVTLIAATTVIGLGIGCSIQNLTLIAQSSVSFDVIGAATSSQSYFRQMGASIGIAIVGAVFVARLTDSLSSLGASASGRWGSLTPAELATLSDAVQQRVATAFADALPPVFVFGVPLALAGLVFAVFIEQRPLPRVRAGLSAGAPITD
ncbi:MAG: MDR family MFS transporter [Microbacterium sp.]|uniref:MDR family MFS transporter n=1 Tax=Microbacterium sp. TaxID=51671 RepID=UPI003F811180